jgi:hypothetical protein
MVTTAVTENFDAVGMQGGSNGISFSPLQLSAFKGKGDHRLFFKLQNRVFCDSPQAILLPHTSTVIYTTL